MERPLQEQPSPPGAPTTPVDRDPLAALKVQVHQSLLAALGPKLYDADLAASELEAMVRRALQEAVAANDTPLTAMDRNRMTSEIADDILGYGPIEPFLRDPGLTEIMVNGPFEIWIERGGKLSKVDAGLPTRRTFAAPSRRSWPASAGESTSPARWSTPGCPTAAVSTQSSRRSPSTVRC